jgi:hypothetical protein
MREGERLEGGGGGRGGQRLPQKMITDLASQQHSFGSTVDKSQVSCCPQSLRCASFQAISRPNSICCSTATKYRSGTDALKA